MESQGRVLWLQHLADSGKRQPFKSDQGRSIEVRTKAEWERLEAEQRRVVQIAQRSSKVIDNVAAFVLSLMERFKSLVDNLATVTSITRGL